MKSENFSSKSPFNALISLEGKFFRMSRVWWIIAHNTAFHCLSNPGNENMCEKLSVARYLYVVYKLLYSQVVHNESFGIGITPYSAIHFLSCPLPCDEKSDASELISYSFMHSDILM